MTFFKLNIDKFILDNFEQSNIKEISYTKLVLSLDRSNEDALKYLNIPFILVTKLVPKEGKSNGSNDA